MDVAVPVRLLVDMVAPEVVKADVAAVKAHAEALAQARHGDLVLVGISFYIYPHNLQ